MMMGFGLALATLGAILRYAIDDTWDSLDVGAVGLILMLVGTVAFGTAVALEWSKRPRGAPLQPYQTPPASMAGAPPHAPPAPHHPAPPPPQPPPQPH